VKAILGEKFIPGFLDRYLADFAWEGQETGEPLPGVRPGNLFEPVPGPFGAHGEFDRRARGRSLQAWASRHRAWLAMTIAALGAWLVGVIRLWKAR
jgi:hypothetical protein